MMCWRPRNLSKPARAVPRVPQVEHRPRHRRVRAHHHDLQPDAALGGLFLKEPADSLEVLARIVVEKRPG